MTILHLCMLQMMDPVFNILLNPLQAIPYCPGEVPMGARSSSTKYGGGGGGGGGGQYKLAQLLKKFAKLWLQRYRFYSSYKFCIHELLLHIF